VAHKVYDTPLLDKLGVREAAKVALLGVRDEAFRRSLAERTFDVSDRLRKDVDVIVWEVRAPRQLSRLPSLEKALRRDGAIWVLRPRGVPELKDEVLIAAAKRAGLVDNKVARFSDNLTAMRLVVPVARR
jgi:hypothetical protein